MSTIIDFDAQFHMETGKTGEGGAVFGTRDKNTRIDEAEGEWVQEFRLHQAASNGGYRLHVVV